VATFHERDFPPGVVPSGLRAGWGFFWTSFDPPRFIKSVRSGKHQLFQNTLRIPRENWEDSYNDWMKNWGLMHGSPDKLYLIFAVIHMILSICGFQNSFLFRIPCSNGLAISPSNFRTNW
jgi:hypothetical protein